MQNFTRSGTSGFDQRFLAAIAVILALAVFGVTWVGIRESRSASLRLLVMQGTAFTEALAQAVENAIISETFFDHLVQMRYAEVARGLAEIDLNQVSDWQLAQRAVRHDLIAVCLLDTMAEISVAGTAHGLPITLPEFVTVEATQLLANPEDRFALLLDESDQFGEAIHYYLELTNDLSRVVVLVADARFYVEALKQTQIGYLARNMAREAGVEYIIYQSTEGIIFASRKTGNLLAIESDPFLTAALESDSIMHRRYEFQDRNVLELVRPFSSAQYPFGLMRVGLSLEGFYSVSRGNDRLMISLAAVLFILLLVVLLYLNSRRKRKAIVREFTKMKTVTDRIFDEMRTGVAAVDPNGTVTLANSAFEQIVGFSGSVGKEWNEVVREPELVSAMDCLEQQVSSEFEVNLSVGKTRRTLLVAVSRLERQAGERSGAVAVVYDITRLKEFEHESTRKERLSEMGNLAAGVAHEIRNPLNTISIAAQRLASEFHLTEDHDEFSAITSQITAETKRLNGIITRFLALARGESQRYQEVNLDELIHDVAGLFHPEAEKLNIELVVRAEPGLKVVADADSLKQVFSNLFNNAKEALHGEPGMITIAARSIEDSVEILFGDNGPGIQADIQSRVFAPYFTTKDGGTGLGLPTVHKIIDDLGGDVKLQQGDPKGAVFVITIPCQAS